MSHIVRAGVSDYNEFKESNPIPPFVLNGLPKKHLGMLIAPPDAGKSMLCLSIAYELATGENIIGVKPVEAPKQRTLIWAAEDGLHLTFQRITSQLKALPAELHHDIRENVSVYESGGPISYSSQTASHAEIQAVKAELEKLVELASQFDLLIIDTVREAIGSASEVADDIRIKEVLKYVAHRADVAVLATHHPTKNVIRGLEAVSSASGSGLSCTVAFARCHFYLKKEQDKRSKNLVTTLIQPKANFLMPGQRLSVSLELSQNLLQRIGFRAGESQARHVHKESMEADLGFHVAEEVEEPAERRKPKVIEASGFEPSQTSVELAKASKKAASPISPELLDKFKKHKGRTDP